MANIEGLDLEIHHEPECVVVRLVGNGSNVYGDQIRNELAGILLHTPPKVVFDLSQLRFINSVLVGVIVEFVVRVRRAEVKMEILEARGQVLQVLRECNVAKLLKFNVKPQTRHTVVGTTTVTHIPPHTAAARSD